MQGFRSIPIALLAALTAFAQEASSPPPATLTIGGDIPAPLTLKAEDLAKMPRQTIVLQEPDGSKTEYAGVPLVERAAEGADRDDGAAHSDAPAGQLTGGEEDPRAASSGAADVSAAIADE